MSVSGYRAPRFEVLDFDWQREECLPWMWNQGSNPAQTSPQSWPAHRFDRFGCLSSREYLKSSCSFQRQVPSGRGAKDSSTVLLQGSSLSPYVWSKGSGRNVLVHHWKMFQRSTKCSGWFTILHLDRNYSSSPVLILLYIFFCPRFDCW